jgi:hypothetical protein
MQIPEGRIRHGIGIKILGGLCVDSIRPGEHYKSLELNAPALRSPGKRKGSLEVFCRFFSDFGNA